MCKKNIQLAELSHRVNQFLPPNLQGNCSVGSLNKGCLIIAAHDALWATELRYALPSLRDNLRKAGLHQLTSIKLIINQPHLPLPAEPVKTKPLSKATYTVLQEAAENCTYEPLKKAWRQLARLKS